jgi:2-(1,2-epoxy-1,2-dihydrophenyl)acetyl-CoA isomerase
MTEFIETSVEDGIADIRFNRSAALNTINVSMAEAFAAAVEKVTADRGTRVIVFSGNGRAFMVGGDLKAFYETPTSDRPELSRRIISPMHQALKELESTDIVSVSSLHGSVAGAGMSIALMTDFAVAAEDVTFNFAYTKIAASPDCGGSFALVRLVGQRRALEIALLSEPVSAQQALAWGLVNQVVPTAQLRNASIELARRLARGSRTALGATKRLLRQSFNSTLEAQLDAECKSFSTLSGQQDFARALDTFFQKK